MSPGSRVIQSACWIGQQPRPAVAEIQAVDPGSPLQAWAPDGDWVSVRVEGIRYLFDRNDLWPENDREETP